MVHVYSYRTQEQRILYVSIQQQVSKSHMSPRSNINNSPPFGKTGGALLISDLFVETSCTISSI